MRYPFDNVPGSYQARNCNSPWCDLPETNRADVFCSEACAEQAAGLDKLADQLEWPTTDSNEG